MTPTASGKNLWFRAALALLRMNARAVRNLLRHSPATLFGPAALLITIPFFMIAPAVLLAGLLPTGLVAGALCVLLALALAGSFGPAPWPQVASPASTLPIPERAFFAHAVLRTVVGAAVGFLVAMIPFWVLAAIIAPRIFLPLLLELFPFAAAVAVTIVLGRTLFASVAGQGPSVQFAARVVLLAWLSVPPILSAAHADGDLVLWSWGPLMGLAWVAAVSATSPQWLQVVFSLALVAVGLSAVLLPVSKYPPRERTTFARAFVMQPQSVASRAALPRSHPAWRRSFEPFPIPRGPQAATSFVARQWMKTLVFAFLLVGALLAVTTVSAFVLRALPAIQVPRLNGALVLTGFYIFAIWFVGLASSPGAADRLVGGKSRWGSWQRRPVRAILRPGPPVLLFKRWSHLQTLPLDRATMNRAFLRPFGLILVASLVLLPAVFYVIAGFDVAVLFPALLFDVTGLVMVGGMMVGSRSNRRFAREHDRVLEAAHLVSASLWLGGILVLPMAGIVGALTLENGAGDPVLGVTAVAAFFSAAVVMPVYAYYSAWERLVAVTRPFESPWRAVGLAACAALYFLVPLGLLSAWLTR